MPDTTPTPSLDPKVLAVAQDALHGVNLGKQTVAAVKQSGMAGLAQQAPALIAELAKDFDDVKAALPAIKDGFKTSEFWLALGVILGNGVYLAVTGKEVPFDLNIVATALVGIYTIARAIIKRQPLPAPAPVPVAA